MRIQHNIAAANSARQLGSNNGAVAKNLEKLSSGFKINRAGDDAAGLAISEKMRSQIKGLETASKNAQDGISLVQTAEGALTEVHSMLNRMVELTTQASNGIYDAGDRDKITTEISALTSEIDRIATNTDFNGTKLLNGTIGGRNFKATGDATSGLTDAAKTGATAITVNGGGLDSANDTTVFKFTGAAGTQAGSKLEIDGGANGISFGQVSSTGNGDKGSITFKALIDESTASKADIAKYSGMTVTVEHDKLVNTAATDVTTTAAYNSTLGGVSGKGLQLQVGDTAAQKINVQINNMTASKLGINAIDVSSAEKAASSIKTINDAINTVSTQRSVLGALQNRLEHTINNLGVTTENVTAAESRIRDVDMAKEMMDFTKNNILTQASQAMLAQANQLPQGVLQLLR